MAVALEGLTDALESSLNVPGVDTPMFDFSDTNPWINALASAFWWARTRGFYVGYRVNVDNEIINVADGPDLEREDQQIIVVFAAMNAIEALMLSMFTMSKDVAGPVSTERQRSSQLLKALLDARRAELEQIRSELIGAGAGTTTRVIDAVLTRSGDCYSGYGSPWVR